MHAATAFLWLLGFIALTVSAPANPDNTNNVKPPALYYLKTSIVGTGPDCGSDKNNLWVYSYHTGAGLGDACLSPNKTDAMQAYLNGTQQLFTYPHNQIGGWPMAISYGDYQLFDLVTISIAAERPTYEGFFFNATGLQYNSSYGGWVVCDWWHGVPQLFNLNYPTPNGHLPKTCSRVNLHPVAAS